MFANNVILPDGLTDDQVSELKIQALNFVRTCYNEYGLYSLTPKSDSSTFTEAFAIFLLHLIGELDSEVIDFDSVSSGLVKGLYAYFEERKKIALLDRDKYFMQLLAFVLSAISLLKNQDFYPLDEVVKNLLPNNMRKYLKDIGSLHGIPQSGNLAMCMAVFSIYGRDKLNVGTQDLIDDWVDAHLKAMNDNGFWGEDNISHLQFQNGYHQYEIFEFLGVHNHKIENAAHLVKKVSDVRGQFAPYFGGSGCYDYDAISILTAPRLKINEEYKKLLIDTGGTILSEQNSDGGFSESQWLRPINPKSIYYGLHHVLNAQSGLRKERGKYFISMMLPKNSTVNTHWTKYSRQWSESDLWDTWFRLLAFARIDVMLNYKNSSRWGFIDFPGIGFHHSVKEFNNTN